MILHPVVPAIVALDLLALAAIAPALIAALSTLSRREPRATAADTLWTERRLAVARALPRPATLVFALSSALLVCAIGSLLPDVVPGAMCGTGVMEALDGAGERTLVLRGLALALLVAWWTLDGIERGTGRAPAGEAFEPASARTLLLAAAPLVLAVIETGRALVSLDAEREVDCCDAVYGAAHLATSDAGGLVVPWAWLSVLGAPLLLLVVVRLARPGAERRSGKLGAAVILAAAALWIAISARAVVETFAAVHYESSSHRCPWCLLTVDHGLVGYPIWGSLVVVGLEAVALAVATGVERREAITGLAGAASWRAARSKRRLFAAVILFLVAAALPALLWRLRTGRWIGGG